MAVLPTATESPLLYACELWVFAMCPALRGSTVSYAGDAHFPKHSLEYSLNFWSQSKKKKELDFSGFALRPRDPLSVPGKFSRQEALKRAQSIRCSGEGYPTPPTTASLFMHLQRQVNN